VVPGLVSPAQTPRPATIPFQSAPNPRPSGGRGQTAPLPSILEGGVGYAPSSSSSRGGLPSTLHVSPTACLPRSWLLNSIAGSEQPLYRRRGGSYSRERGHGGSSIGSSSSQFHQQHLLGQEVKRSGLGDSTLLDGNAPGCPPCHPPWGLGGIHRPSGRLLPHSHPYGRQEVSPLRLDRAPVPILCPSLRSVTRWVP
jgi:hypothetical protein